MSTVSDPLKYKFAARFSDGTKIIQSEADESSTAEGKSAFFDVLEKQKQSILISFRLMGDNEVYCVHMNTGRFSVNGSIFSLEERDEPLTDRKLIYFREVLQHTTMENGTEQPYINKFFFGYEGKNSKGKVIKHIITLDGRKNG